MTYSIQSLDKNPSFFPQVISLIEREFNYDNNNSFHNDFFPLINKKNHKNCYLLIDTLNNKLVGHIGAKKCSLYNDHLSTDVLMLGGIVIDKAYRGKNLFKDFLSNVISKYFNEVALIMLWSNLVKLFERYDFFLTIGQIETTPLNHKKEVTLEKTKLKDLSNSDKDQIQALYQNNSHEITITKRSKEDWEVLESITSTDLFIKRNNENDNEIDFYFLKNKGQDLNNIIHEFGYKNEVSKNELLKCLETEIAILPENYKSIFKHYTLTFTLLLKIGHPEHFFEFIKNFTKNKINIISIEKEHIFFKLDGEELELNLEEFLSMIFGPNIAVELERTINPIFIPGLDSV